MNIREVLSTIALDAIRNIGPITPGFVRLSEADRGADNVSCFSNCLSCRAQCISPTLVPITFGPEGLPYAPIIA